MPSLIGIIFWLLAACVLYTYAIYQIALACIARLRPRPVHRAPYHGAFTILIAAHNEQGHIKRRIEELLHLSKISNLNSEILIVSDGSTDRTAQIAREYESQNVRLIDLPENQGKSAALSHGVAAAKHDIILFADARQQWDNDTIPRLLENFDDHQVGAVSGELLLESSPGVLAGVGLYWRYEKWIRRTESLIGSMASVSGSVAAVRRKLFVPIPAGCVLDDVYWPLCIAMQGYRVVHDSRAKAFDRLPDRAVDEFRRKIRTLSGNFQLLALLPGALVPWRNPVFFQFLSHKILRLIVPWALLAALIISCVIAHPIYRAALFVQLAFYLLALIGLRRSLAARLKPASAAAGFLVLNTAALLAFWVFITGRSTRSWTKISYSS